MSGTEYDVIVERGYVAIVERGDTSFGAYVPDLPGCIAVGKTEGETARLIREAIGLHINSLTKNAEPVPPPREIAIDWEGGGAAVRLK